MSDMNSDTAFDDWYTADGSDEVWSAMKANFLAGWHARDAEIERLTAQVQLADSLNEQIEAKVKQLRAEAVEAELEINTLNDRIREARGAAR